MKQRLLVSCEVIILPFSLELNPEKKRKKKSKVQEDAVGGEEDEDTQDSEEEDLQLDDNNLEDSGDEEDSSGEDEDDDEEYKPSGKKWRLKLYLMNNTWNMREILSALFKYKSSMGKKEER